MKIACHIDIQTMIQYETTQEILLRLEDLELLSVSDGDYYLCFSD